MRPPVFNLDEAQSSRNIHMDLATCRLPEGLEVRPSEEPRRAGVGSDLNQRENQQKVCLGRVKVGWRGGSICWQGLSV